MGLFAAVGRRAAKRWEGIEENLSFLGEAFAFGVATLLAPHRFRFADCALAFERAAVAGAPISIGIGFLLGLILAFESAAALQMFGAEVYVADLLAIGLFRELGPLITAIILAGRSGSAFAAEIGTMKVDEELDALRTMGLEPVQFLVMPRIVAATLAMPALTICCELSGLVGGALVLRMMDVPPAVYWNHVTSMSSQFIILFGLAKAALFGFIIALIGCGAGMNTKSTADGVGVAATRAVVNSIVSIAIADGIIAVLCYVWDL